MLDSIKFLERKWKALKTLSIDNSCRIPNEINDIIAQIYLCVI